MPTDNIRQVIEREQDKSLPPRFRSSAFRRYEAILYQAVEGYPQEVEVDPSAFGLSLCTVEQRLRDAKTSYLKHNWTSTINRDKFIKVVEFLEVRSANGKIYIGPPQPKEQDEVVLGAYRLKPSHKQEPYPFPGTCETDFRLVADLAAQRCLARPVILTIQDTLADSLFASFDINLEKQPNGTYVLT